MSETRWVVCETCNGEGRIYVACLCFQFRECQMAPCERPEPCHCEAGMVEVEVEPITFEEFMYLSEGVEHAERHDPALHASPGSATDQAQAGPGG